MNQKENKELKKVLSTIHMGNNIFRIYVDKCDSENLKDELISIVKLYEKQELGLLERIKKQGCSVDDKLSFNQELKLSKKILSRPKKDFKIVSETLRVISDTTLVMIDFLHDCRKIDSSISDYIKTIINDNDLLIEHLKHFIFDNYC